MDDFGDIFTFVARCDAYAARRGWKRSTLSTALFKDGKRLDRLAGGAADIGFRRFAEARQALAAMEAEWPSGERHAA